MEIKKLNLLLTRVWQNSGFCAFLETFVLVESLWVFRNFGAKSPPHRQVVFDRI